MRDSINPGVFADSRDTYIERLKALIDECFGLKDSEKEDLKNLLPSFSNEQLTELRKQIRLINLKRDQALDKYIMENGAQKFKEEISKSGKSLLKEIVTGDSKIELDELLKNIEQ